MVKFETFTAVAAPLLRDNVDTDAIIPSREMVSAAPEVLADGLFAGWRYEATGHRRPDPGFVLNREAYRDARILVSGRNFGCGSSREHAVWALAGYGFRVVIAASFAPIFFSNCVRNGIVPVQLPEDGISMIAARVEADPASNPVTVDLEAQCVRVAGDRFGFEIDDYARRMLLSGLDEIAVTLAGQACIEAFLQRDRVDRPWIYQT